MAITSDPARTWVGATLALAFALALTSGCGGGDELPGVDPFIPPPGVVNAPVADSGRARSGRAPKKPRVEVPRSDPSSLKLAPGR